MHHESLTEASSGDVVGFGVRGISGVNLHRGLVASHCGEPAKEACSFTAQIVVINHPTHISNGYTPIMFCHSARIPCQFTEILSRIDRKTFQELEAGPRSIKSGDAAMVLMTPQMPVCVECFADCSSMGRFAVLDMNQTVAVGVVRSVTQKSTGKSTKAAQKTR
eukprot:NODE_790_length_1449_cov_46.295000_g653_i0.p2 GENE.NODE_790_length_1449_cov_46.295000_g653_i0~~NODE_790_length_1449_cov_46.295000_g653_i0.p2  ORF type:complete len:164 (-),score=17.27 NODE_790_length_1449_cov_46.295000_g653_i0:138-629(-)